jgi:hypothetical protein
MQFVVCSFYLVSDSIISKGSRDRIVVVDMATCHENRTTLTKLQVTFASSRHLLLRTTL